MRTHWTWETFEELPTIEREVYEVLVAEQQEQRREKGKKEDKKVEGGEEQAFAQGDGIVNLEASMLTPMQEQMVLLPPEDVQKYVPSKLLET